MKHTTRINMNYMKAFFTLLIPMFFSVTAMAGDISAELDKALQAEHRAPENVARDIYRHPKETLMFFDLRSDMKVLEILPGRGWYTEILAPLLQDSGELTVASFGESHPTEYLRNVHNDFIKMINAKPEIYSKVKTVLFENKGYLSDIADNSLDVVVTFRNTHNWIRFGGVEEVFPAFYRVLKPGGILGVVQHRAAAGSDGKASAEKGYVPEKYMIKLAEDAGFELVKKSEINANPKDTKDYPEGVWSLPPSYREKDKNREKYTAIGESDRMTMKFIKVK